MSEQSIKIKNKQDLLQAIDQLNTGEVSLQDIEFNHNELDNHLKSLTIVFGGEELDGMLSTSMMNAVLALQKHVYQSYADAFYSGNIRALTDEDRQNLELFVRVEKGSVIVEILLTIALTKLADKYFAGEKMTDNQQLITFSIILLAIYAGEKIYQFAANKRAKKKSEYLEQEKLILERERIDLEDKDAQRKHELELARIEKDIEAMRLLASQTEEATETVNKTKQFMQAQGINTEMFNERAEKTLKPVLEVAAKKGEAQFGEVIIEADNADILKTNNKNDKQQVQLNGRYRVQIVNTKEAGIFKVHLFNEDNSQEIWAVVQDDNNLGNKKVIQKAEWEKKPLHLTINAFKKDGKIIEATVLTAEWIEGKDN